MTSSSTTPTPKADHRPRVARERRARTRARLLDTILATYRGDGGRGPAVLDEVLAAAGVSKTNFYKHFPSLEAAVVALGERLADEMTDAIISGFEHVTSPPERLATGFQLFLAHAAADPRWAAFVTHGAYLSPQHRLLGEIRKDFERGVSDGDYSIEEIDAAVHLTVGAMVEGMRHVSDASAPPGYVEELTAMALRAMGVPAAAARATVRRAAMRLAEEARALFAWWRPLA